MAASGVTEATEVSFNYYIYLFFCYFWLYFTCLITIFIIIINYWYHYCTDLLFSNLRKIDSFISVLGGRFNIDHLLNRQTVRSIFPSFLPTQTFQLHLIVVGTITAPRLAMAVFTIAVFAPGQRDGQYPKNVSWGNIFKRHTGTTKLLTKVSSKSGQFREKSLWKTTVFLIFSWWK